MVQLIEAELEVNPESVIDFREYSVRATLDNIGLAMMGYDFQTLQHPDNELRRRFGKIALDPPKVFNWIGLLSNYIDLRPLLKLISPLMKKSEVKESSNYIRGVAKRVIEERQEKLRNPETLEAKDVMTVALASGAFPLDELVDHVMLFLTAGHKSTTTAFEWSMYELGRRPEMQRRLRTEIDEALGPALLGTAELGSRVQNLPYLNAICNEIIRCYPFIPLSTKVAEKNTTILGEHIPEGTVVIFAPEAFNHDKTLWGPDAHMFSPERWLETGMANTGGASSPYAMLSFGAGPLNCIGQNFARTELACLVAAVVRRFEIDLVNAETAGQIRAGPFKRPLEGIHARLKIVESS
jgi:cytochrome P450